MSWGVDWVASTAPALVMGRSGWSQCRGDGGCWDCGIWDGVLGVVSEALGEADEHVGVGAGGADQSVDEGHLQVQ